MENINSYFAEYCYDDFNRLCNKIHMQVMYHNYSYLIENCRDKLNTKLFKNVFNIIINNMSC